MDSDKLVKFRKNIVTMSMYIAQTNIAWGQFGLQHHIAGLIKFNSNISQIIIHLSTLHLTFKLNVQSCTSTKQFENLTTICIL